MVRATERRYGANSSEELSGYREHRAKSNSTPAALPSQVTEISPGTACNSFRALPRLRRAQTGRKKAPYPQIVYLLIRENNWAEFIISRVPAHPDVARVCCSCFRVCFCSHRFIRVDCTHNAFHTTDIFECPFEWPLYFATFR